MRISYKRIMTFSMMPPRATKMYIFGTISRELSDHDPQLKSLLWRGAKDNRALRTSLLPLEQAKQLMIGPSKNIDTIGTLIIAVDAIDESLSGKKRHCQVYLSLPPSFSVGVHCMQICQSEILLRTDNRSCIHPSFLMGISSSSAPSMVRFTYTLLHLCTRQFVVGIVRNVTACSVWL